MRTLRNLYLKGDILYPRVENGYIINSLFAYFPHPELNIVNPYFEPLKQKSYPLSDNSLLLHFHNLRYFNISNCESVQQILKGRINGKKRELTILDYKLIENYRFFLNKKNEISFDYFLKKQLSHYQENKPKLLAIDYNKNNILDEILNLHEKINSANTDLPIEKENIQDYQLDVQTPRISF